MPKVTVLMPVYNPGIYLKEAVESILIQTFRDFEFVIIDDGSTDGSKDFLSRLDDKRIRLIHHEKNQGLIATLNEGINIANGQYILRLDADDMAVQDRMERQVAFMDLNKQIGASGTYFKMIGYDHIFKLPNEHKMIHAQMFFRTSLAHPSMIWRTNQFIKHNLFFDPAFKHAEDYELWNRAAHVIQFANLPEILLHYRHHPDQISIKYNTIQQDAMFRVQMRNLASLDLYPDETESTVQKCLSSNNYPIDKLFFGRTINWLHKVSHANHGKGIFPARELDVSFYQEWMMINRHLSIYLMPDIKLIKPYFDTSASMYLKDTIRLILKAVLFRILQKKRGRQDN